MKPRRKQQQTIRKQQRAQKENKTENKQRTIRKQPEHNNKTDMAQTRNTNNTRRNTKKQ